MYVQIILMIFFTSALSGVMGMAGGMILMGYLNLILPVEIAMLLHGISQFWANGFRSYLHRKYILWQVLLPYILASFPVFVILRSVSFVPNKGLVYILLGIFPFLSFLPRLSRLLSIDKPGNAYLCSLTVTAVQIAAGASGAILDVFYVNSKLNRYQIMASKAFTQTVGHTIKLIYYFSLLDWSSTRPELKLELIPLICGSAILGTCIGKSFLDKMNEDTFRKWSKAIILLIGCFMITQGIVNMF